MARFTDKRESRMDTRFDLIVLSWLLFVFKEKLVSAKILEEGFVKRDFLSWENERSENDIDNTAHRNGGIFNNGLRKYMVSG